MVYSTYHPERNNPLGVGDWLTDKDILCWLHQELYHMEIDKPCGLLQLLESRECPSGCKWLNVALQ